MEPWQTHCWCKSINFTGNFQRHGPPRQPITLHVHSIVMEPVIAAKYGGSGQEQLTSITADLHVGNANVKNDQ